MHLLQIAAVIGCVTGALGWDKYATERGYAGTQDPREQDPGGFGSHVRRDANPEALAAWEQEHGGKAPLHQPSFSHGTYWARNARSDADASQSSRDSDSDGSHRPRAAEPERDQYVHELQGSGGHHARDAETEAYYIQPSHKFPSYAQHHARAVYNVEIHDGYGGFGHGQQHHARGEHGSNSPHEEGGYSFGGQQHHARGVHGCAGKQHDGGRSSGGRSSGGQQHQARDAFARGGEHESDGCPSGSEQRRAGEASAHGDEYHDDGHGFHGQPHHARGGHSSAGGPQQGSPRHPVRNVPGYGSPHVNLGDQHGHHARAVRHQGFTDQRRGGRQPLTPTSRSRHLAPQASNVTTADTVLNTATVAAEEPGAEFRPSAFDPKIPQADTDGTQFSRRDAGMHGSYIGGGNFDGHRPPWAREADVEPGVPAHNLGGSHRPHHARGMQARSEMSDSHWDEAGTDSCRPHHARNAVVEAFRSSQRHSDLDHASAAHRPHQARDAQPAGGASPAHAQAGHPKQKSGWRFPW